MLFGRLFKLIAIFVIAMAGGIFADQILWPYFVERPLFYRYGLDKAPVYLTEKKEISIEENTALTDAVEKVGKAVVGVKTKTKTGMVIEGSGLILTADGLVVTTADLLPQGGAFYFFVDNEWPAFRVLKADLKQNLALIKVEKTNLPTVGFADFDKTRPGERLFLVARDFGAKAQEKFFAVPSLFVNEGIVRTINENSIQTNIFEKKSFQGSPLFNVKGEVAGLAVIDAEGRVNAIPISKIRAFTGL